MEGWLTLNQKATECMAEPQQKAYHLLFGPQNPRESIYEMTLTVFYFYLLLYCEIPPGEIHSKTQLYRS